MCRVGTGGGLLRSTISSGRLRNFCTETMGGVGSPWEAGSLRGGLERGGLVSGGGGAVVMEGVFLGGTTGGGAEETVVGTVVSRAGMWGNVSSVVSFRIGTGGGACSSGVMDFLEMDRGKGFGRVGTLGDKDGGVVLPLIPIFLSSVLALSRMLFGVRGGESSFSFTLLPSSSLLVSVGGFGATRAGSGLGFLVGVGGRWFGLSCLPFGSVGLGLGGMLGLGGSFSELSRDSFERFACLSLCLSQGGFSAVCGS